MVISIAFTVIYLCKKKYFMSFGSASTCGKVQFQESCYISKTLNFNYMKLGCLVDPVVGIV
jgi:hypothetical protein